MALLFALFAVTVLQWASSQETCPAAYARLSKNHSFCKPRNPTCNIVQSGIQDQNEKDLIVNIHNQYRNKVATGKEDGLLKAANMMQMEWDDELASVAQKWAEQCVFAHDCNDCRAVENFGVGQNIAYMEGYGTKPNWHTALKMFYDEVFVFDPKIVDSFRSPPNVVIGHFTQIVWAETWRVGCGYVVYKRDSTRLRQLYVCNYGPAGNMYNAPIYKTGTPCTACPINSRCGNNSTNTADTNEGLCKMVNANVAPVFKKNTQGQIFNCDFADGNKDCPTNYQRWQQKKTLSGDMLSIKLNGGETSKLDFPTPVVPTKSGFCLEFQFRKGPALDGQVDSSNFKVFFHPEGYSEMTMQLKFGGKSFMKYRISMRSMPTTKFSISFSVPQGAPAQILDIRDIVATDGSC